MIKFVCLNHKNIELEARTVNLKHKIDRIAVEPCPACYEFARRNGKQYVYNTITKNLSDMIIEKKDEEDE